MKDRPERTREREVWGEFKQNNINACFYPFLTYHNHNAVMFYWSMLVHAFYDTFGGPV